MSFYESKKILVAALDALDAAHVLLEIYKQKNWSDADKLLILNQKTRQEVVVKLSEIEKDS